MATLPELYSMLKKSFDEYGSSDDDIKSFELSLKDEKIKLDETVKKIQEDFSGNFQPIFDKISNDYNNVSFKLKQKREITEKAFEVIAKMSEESRPMLAVSVYEKCQRLKDDIDILESNILAPISSATDVSFAKKYHGLRNSEKLNVFLVGEFSSGKTSFTRRLIDDLSGSTSGAPETACLVVHRRGDAQSISAKFQGEICFEDTDKSYEFEKFLRDFDLRTIFKEEQNKWRALDDEFTEDRWSKEKILDFIKRSNSYPEVFVRITWTHVKSGRNKNLNTFLDFANIYDMPGIAGEVGHNKVIDNVFASVQPDIVLYLIDTARGVPSEEEANTLRNIAEKLIAINEIHQPDFYWVYQKPSTYSDNIEDLKIDELVDNKNVEWIEQHIKILNDFLNALKTGNAKVAVFQEQAVKYLKDSYILDARGPFLKDTERAQNAVASTLIQYYSWHGNNYISEVKKCLSISPVFPNILKRSMDKSLLKNNEQNSASEILKSVISKVKYSDNTSPESLRSELEKELGVDISLEGKNIYPADLQATITSWLSQIKAIINEIVEASIRQEVDNRSFLDKVFSSEKNENKEISFDYLSRDFWQRYNSEIKWQELVYLSQALNWVIESYSGDLVFYNIAEIGNELAGNILRGIQKLEALAETTPFITALPKAEDA